MIPSSSSFSPIVFLPRRAARSAASLTRFARSAPVRPGVPAASVSRSISGATGLPFVCTSTILRRPFRSGLSTTIWRSKRPGRPVEEDALRDSRAERLELLRVLEELLDLLELLDRLVHAGDVLEGDLRRVRRHPLGAALAEAHHLRAATLDLVHEEDPEAEEEDERQQVGEDRPPGRAPRAFRVELDPVRLELLLEGELGLVAGIVDLGLLAVNERLDRAALRVEDHVRDGARIRVDVLDQL